MAETFERVGAPQGGRPALLRRKARGTAAWVPPIVPTEPKRPPRAGFAPRAAGVCYHGQAMNKTLTYGLLVFIAGASYGFIVPIVKTAASFGIDVNDFLPLQYIAALLVMGGAAAALWRKTAHPSGVDALKLASIGLFAACTSLCYYRAVTLLPSSVALTMLFQFVWIGPLIDCIAERKLPSPTTVLAIAIVLVGTAFAAGLFEEGTSNLDPLGIAVGLASAVFYSLFLFLSGRIATQYCVPIRTSMLCIGGFATTFIVNPGVFSSVAAQPSVIVFALIMGAVGVVIPTGLIAFASPKLSPSMVSIMAASELPVGVIAAWIFIADAPTGLGLFGVALVLAGIVVNQIPALLSHRQKRRAGGRDDTAAPQEALSHGARK